MSKPSRILIIGMGHVGTWLYTYMKKYHKGIQTLDLPDLPTKIIKLPIDVMHICYPYSSHFVTDTVSYIYEYQPRLVIINSTVRLGTTITIHHTVDIEVSIVHSPVRGRSDQKGRSRGNWYKCVKMIGPTSRYSGNLAKQHFESMGIKTKILNSPLETELGKILDTTIYGLNIAFVQEVWRICKTLKIDFKQAYRDFTETFTEDPQYAFPRHVYFPGFIGKTCVIPNAELLDEAYPSNIFVKGILESNKKRKEEIDANPNDLPS